MDSINFARGYGKVNSNHLEVEDQVPNSTNPHPKTHQKCLVAILALLLLSLLIGLMLGAFIHNTELPESASSSTTNSAESTLRAVSNVTRYLEAVENLGHGWPAEAAENGGGSMSHASWRWWWLNVAGTVGGNVQAEEKRRREERCECEGKSCEGESFGQNSHVRVATEARPLMPDVQIEGLQF